MRICFFSMQLAELGFTGNEQVSYSAIQIGQYDEDKEEMQLEVQPKPKFYTHNEIVDMYCHMMVHADLIVGYYLPWAYDILRNNILDPNGEFDPDDVFATFDISQMINKETDFNIKLDTIARAVGTNRLGSGRVAVGLWQNGHHDKLKEFIERDLTIIQTIYERGAKEKLLRIPPRYPNGDPFIIATHGWRQRSERLAYDLLQRQRGGSA